MEQHRGFEPPQPVWKTGMLTVKHQCCIFGADEGSRTPTLSLAVDFESTTSANSITSACQSAFFSQPAATGTDCEAGRILWNSTIYGGESGIRTHGGLSPITSFQDWLLKPLGHLAMWCSILDSNQ